MVTIKIFVEGGTHPNNSNAATVSNSSALRESFNKIFNRILEKETIRIECDMRGSWTSAVKDFKRDNSESRLILIDLDGPEDAKPTKLTQLQLEAHHERTFFMVQEMEGWILAQLPEIQEGLKTRYSKTSAVELKEDELVKGRNAHEIQKPSRILDQILRKHFVIKNGENEKPLKYGKLKVAPELILMLDLRKLANHFSDVERLLLKIQSLSTTE